MKSKLLYYIISILLIPFGLLIFIALFPMLLAAITAPTAMLPLFVLICILIYIVCSFIFIEKGIKRNLPCKKSLKDWIKVNAYVSIFFVVLMLIQSFMIINNPNMVSEQLLADINAQQQNLPEQFTPAFMHKMLKFISYFMLVNSLIIGLHIILTFKQLKIYQHLFSKE